MLKSNANANKAGQNYNLLIPSELIARIEELLDKERFTSVIQSNWGLTQEGLDCFIKKNEEISKRYNKKELREKGDEIHEKTTKEVLQNLKDGDKLYFLYEYIGILIERGESARANSILSLVFSSLKKEDSKDKMRTIGMFTQQNIESKYLLGDYEYLQKNERYIFLSIGKLRSLVLTKTDFTQKLVYIENLSCLAMIFSLYLMDVGKTKEAETLIILVLNLQRENGVDKYFLRLQSKLTQLYIKINEEKKATKNFLIFKENLKNYKTNDFSLQNFELDENDMSTFLITELELFIKLGGEDNKYLDKILNNIEKLSEIENIDYDNKIKFEYLKGLCFYNLSRNYTKITSLVRKRVEAIISQKGGSEKLEFSENRDFLEESKIILQNLLRNFDSNENKTFFIDSLILLSEIEKDRETSIEKDIETSTSYFFQAWNFNKKHFGKDYQKSIYFKRLLDLGKKFFPDDKVEHLSIRVENYDYEKQKLTDSNVLGDVGEKTEIQEILRKAFGIKELLVHELGGEKIQVCSIFKNLDGCKGCGGQSGTECILLRSVKEKLDAKKWKRIFNIKDPIELVNSPYYSKTLVGILINVGPKYFLALVGKGENNSTDFTENDLQRIPFYLREIFLKDIIKEYSTEVALMESLRYKLLEIFTNNFNNLIAVLGSIADFVPEAFEDLLKEIGYSGDKIGNIIEFEESFEDLKGTTERLRFMSRNIKKLLEFVNAIEEKKDDYQPVDIVKILKDVIRIQNIFMESKEKKLKINFSGDSKTLIKGLEDEFILIFDNIVENAVKFSKNKGKINIDMKVSGNKLIISIQDNGVGMPPEDCEKIFDYKAQVVGNKYKSQGAGIGLYLVDMYVKKYGGTVSAFTKGVGKGMTITVTLPL